MNPFDPVRRAPLRMALERVVIENYRAVTRLDFDLHPKGAVFFGGNGKGKTSVLNAIAVGLGSLLSMLPGATSIAFRQRDRREGRPARVELETADGTKWDRTRGGPRRLGRLDRLRFQIQPIVYADEVGRDPLPLPIVAFYDSDRTVEPDRRPGARPPKPARFAALDGALSPRPDFRAFFAWFAAKEREEATARRERSDLGYRLPELEAVRRAVAAAIPGLSDPTIAEPPPRFCVSVTDEAGTERLALDRLGGGDRLLLALVADLARRMAQANPHFPEQGKDPLQAEAVVLIDEVELHLHPSREQRVLPDLQRAFPNTQFLVSTNSPQVLSTVESDRLIDMDREDGEIVAGGVVDETYGAEAATSWQRSCGSASGRTTNMCGCWTSTWIWWTTGMARRTRRRNCERASKRSRRGTPNSFAPIPKCPASGFCTGWGGPPVTAKGNDPRPGEPRAGRDE